MISLDNLCLNVELTKKIDLLEIYVNIPHKIIFFYKSQQILQNTVFTTKCKKEEVEHFLGGNYYDQTIVEKNIPMNVHFYMTKSY